MTSWPLRIAIAFIWLLILGYIVAVGIALYMYFFRS